MATDYGRIHRLLKILVMIQSGRSWSAQSLARECGKSVRTIFRDLRTLEAAGVPCQFNSRRGGYQVRADFFMPPVELTIEESLSLAALGEQVAGQDQIPLTRAAARAIEKVRCQLPGPIRQEVEQTGRHLRIRLAATAPEDGSQDVYDLVHMAIRTRRVLRCGYEAAHGSDPGGSRRAGPDEEFEFEPYTLFFSQRAWYAVGRHGGRRGAIRCLKLSRFTRCQLAGRRYEIPRSFRLDDHLGLAWRMIRGGRRHEVVIEFDAEFAETVADTRWHATQSVEWREDGSMVFRCQVDGLDEIVWWVLSMGPHCRVVRPRELADRVADLGRGVAAVYA
ncbi:MAG: WYL domain-containing protein [Phycisphaeraceae bacterium]|nr:WYL domain-containing protein [Phycisphaeraceae bacterium]